MGETFSGIFKYALSGILETIFFESGLRLLNRYFSKARPKRLSLGFHENLPQTKLCMTRTSVHRDVVEYVSFHRKKNRRKITLLN